MTDLLGLARSGLPPRVDPPKMVVVVGAGMAGLVAAWELRRAGHQPVLLEARGRVGGRIYTLREPFADGLHAELGAMRIPKTHALTLAYCERFGLPLVPFTASNPNAYVHFGGRRLRAGKMWADPAALPFELAPHERGRPIETRWARAIAELAGAVTREGEAAWPGLVQRFDDYSTRELLERRRRQRPPALRVL